MNPQIGSMDSSNSTFIISCDDDNQSIDSNESSIKITGRQLINKEFFDNDEDPKTKRKAQNRVAQRAFRERKERYVKKLEDRIKQMQKNHVHNTTQLSLENQQLKYIVCKLREQLCNSVGIQLENKPWFSTANSSSNVNSPCTTMSFKPLQIRPSFISESSTIPNIHKKLKRHHTTMKESDTADSEKNRKKSSSSCQQIKFSISTPATLRADSYNESARKSAYIPAVQLYPDHKHPANYMIGREKTSTPHLSVTPMLSPTTKYNSSCSVTSTSSDEDEKNTAASGNDQEFGNILESFLRTHDISTCSNNNSLSSALILKQILRVSSNLDS
ncbi:hypothetical protein MFLAVUS_008806 [Mucor flavus]|uniref:BZIP domain-containing protein n=1 Tax=Mucor flavus TaxID=439312 RepID=A0ABP9Z846_9FUNG